MMTHEEHPFPFTSWNLINQLIGILFEKVHHVDFLCNFEMFPMESGGKRITYVLQSPKPYFGCGVIAPTLLLFVFFKLT